MLSNVLNKCFTKHQESKEETLNSIRKSNESPYVKL